MIYYEHKISFTNVYGNPCVVSMPQRCEDADYATSLEETKLIVQQQAWAVNDFHLVTVYTEETNNITASQYNASVADPDGAQPIPDWDPNNPQVPIL
jgi:hypothetical protein